MFLFDRVTSSGLNLAYQIIITTIAGSIPGMQGTLTQPTELPDENQNRQRSFVEDHASPVKSFQVDTGQEIFVIRFSLLTSCNTLIQVVNLGARIK